jgi:hypothetical protein
LEVDQEGAIQTVNGRFQELIASKPQIGQIIAVRVTGRDELPGTVVAVESVHAWPVEPPSVRAG